MANIRGYQSQIKQQQKNKGQTTTSQGPKQKGPSNLYKNWLANRQAEQAQAQAKAQARQQAQAQRAQQAQAKARADALKRQKALADAERNRRRSEAQSKRRLERRRQHRVTRQDTPESIAEQYKTTPQSIVDRAGVSRLRAGQVIDVFEPYQQVTVEPKVGTQVADLSAYNEQRRAQATGEGFERAEMGTVEQQMLQLEEGLTQSLTDVGQFHEVAGTGRVEDPYRDPQDYAYTQDSWERSGQELWEAQMGKKANQQKYIESTTIRWIGQSVNYVYGMVESGQMTFEEGRNKFRNTEMKKNADGSYSYTLGDKWMTFTEEEYLRLPESTQLELLGLGWQPNGLGQVVPVQLEEQDFGMGGYAYDGGYGYGGGYGGGGYKPEQPKPRTSTALGYQTGGRYQQQRQRLAGGSVPPAHWRI